MKCKGCGQVFEELDEGYCNSDCQLESETRAIEEEEWDALGDDYD